MTLSEIPHECFLNSSAPVLQVTSTLRSPTGSKEYLPSIVKMYSPVMPL